MVKRNGVAVNVDPDIMVFGTKKTLTQFLLDGFLREIIVHQELFTRDEQRDKLLHIASQVGCTVHIVSSHCPESMTILNGYGGIIGVKWF